MIQTFLSTFTVSIYKNYSNVIIIQAVLLYYANKLYFSGGKCKSQNRLDGKVSIITGSNTGIGYETALDFAKRGLHLLKE